MPAFNLATIITSTAETVAAIVMAILLLGFLRQYKKSYLRHWTLSWTALAAYDVASATGIALGVGYNIASNHPVRVLTSMLGGVFGYTSVVFLLFGIFELLRRRPVRIRTFWRTLGGAALLGAVLALLFIGPDAVSSTRYFVRVGIRSLAACIAYLSASIAFFDSLRVIPWTS